MLRKWTTFTGKNFHASLKGMKKTDLINSVVKIFENYASLCVFSELCEFAPRIIHEARCKKRILTLGTFQ